MKKLILLAFLVCTSLSFAGDVIESSKEDQVKYFDLLLGVHHAYSQSAQLRVKVIELLGGEGENGARIFVALRGNSDEEAKVFELNEMLARVTRVTFLTKEIIVINYEQNSFDENSRPSVIKKSVKVKVLRNADNTLTDRIEILK